MIQESYVTFEQAKTLKELGFPQGVSDHFFDEHGDSWLIFSNQNNFNDSSLDKPSLSLVQKWLREEKELYVQIYYVDINNYGISICTPDYQHDADIYIPIEGIYSYEKALSIGIDKCIELLNNKL